MLTTLLWFLIYVIVLCAVAYLIQVVVTSSPLPANVKQAVIMVLWVIVIIGLLILLLRLLPAVPFGPVVHQDAPDSLPSHAVGYGVVSPVTNPENKCSDCHYNEDLTRRRKMTYKYGPVDPILPMPVPYWQTSDPPATGDHIINKYGEVIPVSPEARESLKRLNGYMPRTGEDEYVLPIYIKGPGFRYYPEQYMPRAGE